MKLCAQHDNKYVYYNLDRILRLVIHLDSIELDCPPFSELQGFKFDNLVFNTYNTLQGETTEKKKRRGVSDETL